MIKKIQKLFPCDQHSLTGYLLVSMPYLSIDTSLEKSLIYVCAHGPNGAIGLVINKLINEVTFYDLLDHEHFNTRTIEDILVHYGGPNSSSKGIVLHSSEYQHSETLMIGMNFSVTSHKDILIDMLHDKGPEKALLALGYIEWAPGQLESELKQNYWITISDPSLDLVFQRAHEKKWNASFDVLGISPDHLITTLGNA